MNQALKRWLLYAGLVALVLLVDQTAKYVTITELELGETWIPIPAISGIFRVTRSLNTGAAFGMFQGGSSFFMVLALITVAAFILSYPRLPDDADLTRVSVGLITGGALSNAIDRLRFDHVIDYFHVILTPNFSNISNFADHAITLGVIILLYDQWQAERREKEAERLAEEAAAANDSLEADEQNRSPDQTDLVQAEAAQLTSPDLHGNEAHITMAAEDDAQTESAQKPS